jgi:hypothetical protein
MARKAKRNPEATAPTTASRKFTVPEVWRHIVKKNERHGRGLYDVLVCDHSVPANDNTYRKARSCPECRIKVQEYADRQRPQKPNAG